MSANTFQIFCRTKSASRGNVMEDAHAMCDAAGIGPGQIAERLGRLVNKTPDVAMQIALRGDAALLAQLLAGAGAVSEAVETFLLNLSSPSGGATLAKSFGTGTIQQNPILLNVAVSRASGKAPLSIGFDATGTTSALTVNPSHDIYYIWDFGDDKSETFTRGAVPGQNMNVSYGDVAGHVYKTAGTFTWNVTAIDGNGNVQTKSGSVTVTDWAMADTYWVANGTVPVPGVNGVPSDAVNCSSQTTWAAVAALWADNKRIMLKRGDTWVCSAIHYVKDGLEINAFGTGAAPIVSTSAANVNPCAVQATTTRSDFRVVGVRHLATGSPAADAGTLSVSGNTTNMLLLDVVSENTTFGVITVGDLQNETFIQNCDFKGHSLTAGAGLPNNISLFLTRHYGLYVLGNNFQDTASHIVRIPGAQRLLFDSNRLRNCDVNAVGRDAFTLRTFEAAVLADWSGIYTENIVISNNDMDVSAVPTATLVLQIKPQNTGTNGRCRRVLVERNFVAAPGAPFDFHNQDTITVRNNIGVMTGPGSGSGLIAIRNQSGVGAPNCVNVNIYNNTLYMPNATTSFAMIYLHSATTDTRIKNNLAYAPAQTTAKFLETNGGVTPTQSNNSSDAQTKNTRPWLAASPTAPADFTPSGSYAVDGGVTLANVQRDFFNTTISGTREIGAVQA